MCLDRCHRYAEMLKLSSNDYCYCCFYCYYSHHFFKGRITHYLIIFHVHFHWRNGKERDLEKRAEGYELRQSYVGLWALSHPWPPWQLGKAMPLSPFYKSRNRQKKIKYSPIQYLSLAQWWNWSQSWVWFNSIASGSRPSFLFLTLKKTYFAFPSSLHHFSNSEKTQVTLSNHLLNQNTWML